MRNDGSVIPHAWKIVLLLSGAFVINYIDRQVVFSIFPFLRRDLGFTDATLGAAGTAFAWTYSLMMPVSGFLADRFSRSRLVVLALVLWSLAKVMTGLSMDATQSLLSRVVMGICESELVFQVRSVNQDQSLCGPNLMPESIQDVRGCRSIMPVTSRKSTLGTPQFIMAAVTVTVENLRHMPRSPNYT